MAGSGRRPAVATILAVVGGAATVAGCFLVWLDVGNGVSIGTVSVTGTPKGNELLLGQVALVAGGATIVFGLLLLALPRARRILGLLIFVGGEVAIGAAVYVAAFPEDQYSNFAVDQGAPSGQAAQLRDLLANMFQASGLRADRGIGLYVVVGGGAITIVAGLAAVFFRGERAQRGEDVMEQVSALEREQRVRAYDREEQAAEVEESRHRSDKAPQHEALDTASEPVEVEDRSMEEEATRESPLGPEEPAIPDETSETPGRPSSLGDEWAF